MKEMKATLRAPRKIIPFLSKGPIGQTDDGQVVDYGSLGNVQYEVYKRPVGSVIHIFADVLRFKKDIDAFEKAFDAIDFSNIKDGDERTIAGSGNNDDLVFVCEKGEVSIHLRKKGHSVIDKLKRILKQGV